MTLAGVGGSGPIDSRLQRNKVPSQLPELHHFEQLTRAGVGGSGPIDSQISRNKFSAKFVPGKLRVNWATSPYSSVSQLLENVLNLASGPGPPELEKQQICE